MNVKVGFQRQAEAASADKRLQNDNELKNLNQKSILRIMKFITMKKNKKLQTNHGKVGFQRQAVAALADTRLQKHQKVFAKVSVAREKLTSRQKHLKLQKFKLRFLEKYSTKNLQD